MFLQLFIIVMASLAVGYAICYFSFGLYKGNEQKEPAFIHSLLSKPIEEFSFQDLNRLRKLCDDYIVNTSYAASGMVSIAKPLNYDQNKKLEALEILLNDWQTALNMEIILQYPVAGASFYTSKIVPQSNMVDYNGIQRSVISNIKMRIQQIKESNE